MKSNPKNPTAKSKPRGIGIALRIALLSWIVTLVTLLIFVFVTLPQQKQTFLTSLESKANGLAASLHDVSAGAAVNEDYASVVSAAQTLLVGDPDLDFLIVMKNDGFSLVIEQDQWKVEPQADPYWYDRERTATGGITTVPVFKRRVFHFAEPFDYSGIQWGWIHVGLSLEGYDRSVADLYRNTIFLAVGCIVFSLLASLIYARQMVRPILRLRILVRKIAGGDLSVRAETKQRDELGSLADSVNTMAEALLRRDAVLTAVSFAVQKLLQEHDWQASMPEILAHLGEAASMRYIYLERYSQIEDPRDQPVLFQWRSNTTGSFEPRDRLLAAEGQERIELSVSQRRWGYLVYDLSPLLEVKGAPQTVHGAMRTVAGNLEAAMERRATLVRLKSANRAKDDFLANMSHELRTPLNHIIGFNELVLTEQFGELNEIQSEYLSDVLTSSKHLLALINDILDISKVESGKVKFEPRNFNIGELVGNSLVMVKEKANKNNIDLELVNDHIPEHITADERLLKQVLYNLLGNAIKFTPKNGTITLEARQFECPVRTGKGPDAPPRFFYVDDEPPTDLEDPHIKQQTCLEIAVTDSGIGIAPENLSRVFNRFDQVDDVVNRQYEGTGLGLSLAKAFIELHGGRIWAESEGKNRGSTFRFLIPV